jgi:hypothetical protein
VYEPIPPPRKHARVKQVKRPDRGAAEIDCNLDIEDKAVRDQLLVPAAGEEVVHDRKKIVPGFTRAFEPRDIELEASVGEIGRTGLPLPQFLRRELRPYTP